MTRASESTRAIPWTLNDAAQLAMLIAAAALVLSGCGEVARGDAGRAYVALGLFLASFGLGGLAVWIVPPMDEAQLVPPRVQLEPPFRWRSLVAALGLMLSVAAILVAFAIVNEWPL